MTSRELERFWGAAVRLSRRSFLKAGLGGFLAALTSKRAFARKRRPPISLPPDAPVEYIVVGSGAGGGPLACNLARAGHKVVLLEAGDDNPAFVDNTAAIPYFAGFTSESPVVRWDYWVRHYANTAQQMQDSKYLAAEDPGETGGIWYPRVGALGGCTIHHFMIEIYPSDSDWEYIAKLTGDSSWNPVNMRKYFERFEECRYVQPRRGNPSRHGFNGWQASEIPNPRIFGSDSNILRILRSAADHVYRRRKRVAEVLQRFFDADLDPNDWRLRHHREGMFNIPLFTRNGRRAGPRELILQTAAELPNNLIVQKNSLVKRVLFDEGTTTAIGVEYFEGAHLYRADPNSGSSDLPSVKQMYASREVILSAGTFNSPQILKLSGIGPTAELSALGVPVIVDLPGVGQNLQDRYEVGIVTEMRSNFTNAAECTFEPGDPCYAAWLNGEGVFTSNGAVGCLMHKSDTAKHAHAPDPDLMIIAAPTRFKGFFFDPATGVGYAEQDLGVSPPNQATWLVLKGHTLNRAGTVELRSADPRDTPKINFHYFEEGSDEKMQDLLSVVDGVEFIRRMNARIADITNGEVFPGPAVQTREDIANFVRNEAWGHHASCTNKIGSVHDPMAVLDSNFRVRGTERLRVVDASVFPRIPGYFILTPIFMISEKASDVILADAG